jgi:galactose-1-phosphate uridylyltransferase
MAAGGHARRFKFNQSTVHFGLIDWPISVMRLQKRLE